MNKLYHYLLITHHIKLNNLFTIIINTIRIINNIKRLHIL